MKANNTSRVLGIIPARGGSKGVPHKNLRKINDHPLIGYTIQAAIKSQRLNRVIVSTDCEEIAEVAQTYGADVPFIRPAELAADDTTDAPVLAHALQWLKENEGSAHEIAVYLRPTTPFKTGALIDQVINHLEANHQFDSVRTITRSEGIYHPYWMYRQTPTGTIEPFVDGICFDDYNQRQLLPECFRLNGLVDAVRAENLNIGSSLYGNNIGMIETDISLEMDIDTEFDLQLCSFLMQKKINSGQ